MIEVGVDVAWSRFTRLLAARLTRVTSDRSFTVWMTDDNNITTWDDEDEIYDEMDGTKPYIQGRNDERGRVIAEVTGNGFLHPDYLLDKAARRHLRGLGWSRPKDNEESHNYWTIVTEDREFEVAGMMIRALREVFGVEHPRSLDSLAFYWDEDELVTDYGWGGEGVSYDVVRGDPASSVILHVPHSSREFPPDRYLSAFDVLLDDEELEAELDAMTDADTDTIAEAAADRSRLRPWIFVNRLSRLVVDPERFPDEREEMNKVGMGAVYERTSAGDVLREPTPDQRAELIERFFVPYSDGLARLVRERLQAVGQVTTVDVHSYPKAALPYELHGDGPRPEICVGTDSIHTAPALREAAVAAMRAAAPTEQVGLDSPFAGCYIPLEQYGVSPAVQGVMVELRRDVVADHREALVRGVAALVDVIDG